MICKLLKYVVNATDLLNRFWVKYVTRYFYRCCLGYCGNNVDLRFNKNPGSLNRIYLYDNTNIYHGFRFVSVTGKFVMKRNSGAASGLTVITGNHQRECGKFIKEISGNHDLDVERDVIIEEDVWIAANVTLLSGVTIGRGATVGAGSVCYKSVPPYSVVMGNPAKVIGFNYSPEEIIEHEKALYPEKERLPLEMLEKNYDKYFITRIKEIKDFIRI